MRIITSTHVYNTVLIFFTLAGSGVDSGVQYQLRLIYEHNLQRTSFNFTYGPFGGVKGEFLAFHHQRRDILHCCEMHLYGINKSCVSYRS